MRTTRVEALERGRRRLVAWASDDLRSPVEGLRSLIEQAAATDAGDDPATGQRHRLMLQEIHKISETLDDLVTLAGEVSPLRQQSGSSADAQIFDLVYEPRQAAG